MSTQATIPTQVVPPPSAEESSSKGNRRVNVIFTKEQYDTLQQLAASQKISVSEALRQAIGVSNYIVGVNFEPGTQILLKRGDAVTELKLLR